MRAIRARYDPYEQSKGRVEQLRALGHSVDKVSFLRWPRSAAGDPRPKVLTRDNFRDE